MMSTIYLNIGSNQGDRHALIEQAVALITDAYPDAQIYRSDYIETEPWGYVSEHPFLNLGLALIMNEQPEPLDLLHRLQYIEKAISLRPHRNADGSYRDRDIDIDIIAIDNLRLSTPEITLPHPRAWQREFVLRPFKQLYKVVGMNAQDEPEDAYLALLKPKE